MEQKTIHEQITEFENSRAAKHARMTAIMTTSAEAGATLDQAETDEYDGLTREIKAIDAHLVRLRALEATTIARRRRRSPPATPEEASAQRSGMPIISVKSNLPPGHRVHPVLPGAGRRRAARRLQAVEYAKQWHDSTPEVELVLKAAVAAGTTTDATWAGPARADHAAGDRVSRAAAPADDPRQGRRSSSVPFNVSVARADRRRHVSVGRPGRAEAGRQAGVRDDHARDHEVRRDHRDHRGARAHLDAVGRGSHPARHDRRDRGVPRSRSSSTRPRPPSPASRRAR